MTLRERESRAEQKDIMIYADFIIFCAMPIYDAKIIFDIACRACCYRYEYCPSCERCRMVMPRRRDMRRRDIFAAYLRRRHAIIDFTMRDVAMISAACRPSFYFSACAMRPPPLLYILLCHELFILLLILLLYAEYIQEPIHR